jgi:ADP-heptose:LPS heptosyltransferase
MCYSVVRQRRIHMSKNDRDAGAISRMSDSHSGAAAAALFKKYKGKRRLAARLLEIAFKPFVLLSKSKIAPDLDKVRNILVFEPGSLGDIVMLAPFLRSLRARFPQAFLSVLCRSGAPTPGKGYASINAFGVQILLLEQGLADELIPIAVPWLVDVSPWKRYSLFSLRWPSFLWHLSRLRPKSFDIAFPGGRSDIRYNLALWMTGASRRVGYGFGGGGLFLTDVVTPDLGRPHQTELSLQLLEHLGIQTIPEAFRLTVTPEDRDFSARFLAEHGIRSDDLLIGIHPGSRVPTRQWGRDRFLHLAERLTTQFGAKILWFSEPGDASAPPDQKIISASFLLRRFLAIVSQCRLLICNESGPMHLAASMGVPVVSVFGSGFPEWFRPLGEGHRIVVRRDIWCRPCGDRCIHPEPYCLSLIPVDQVMKEVTELIADLRNTQIPVGSKP